MTVPNHYVFVDTNCFIHLRDLKDISWPALFPKSNWIEIVIAPLIYSELDRFKTEREGRRRDRSRMALTLIEKASEQKDFRLVLKKTPQIVVSLRVAETPRLDWDRWPRLDPARFDDQLIAATLAEVAPEGCEISLLSYYTGPLIRARLIGLKAHRPPEDWSLPNQPDEAAQEIAKLKRELGAALATRPKIEAGFMRNGATVPRLVIPIPQLPPLSAPTFTALQRAYLSEHRKLPLKQRGSSIFSAMSPDHYSDETIARYDNKYSEFCNNVIGHFSHLHETVEAVSRATRIEFFVNNSSFVTASNALVEFRCADDAIVIANEDDATKLVGSLAAPSPPEKPRSQTDLFTLATLVDYSSSREPRAPTSFYYQVRPAGDAQLPSLLCAEFRAGRNWKDSFYLMPKRFLPYEGMISLEIGATNLPAPVRIDMQVRLESTSATWSDAQVSSMLEPWVNDIIAAGA